MARRCLFAMRLTRHDCAADKNRPSPHMPPGSFDDRVLDSSIFHIGRTCGERFPFRPQCPTREAATENLAASLLNHLMNMDQASGPRMPWIKKLVLRGPVGVPSSCCTTPSERIGHRARMRRFLARFIRPDSFVHTRSSAGFTITTPEFEFSVHTSVH
jgi:hypothetical protein